MVRPDKKQRHAAKRAQKKLESRRRESVSPLKRLADADGPVECWMSDDFEVHRQCSLHAFKRGEGLSGAANFLIDRGVVGLKDAWCLIPCDSAQRQKIFDGARESGLRLVRVTPEVACARIAAAARWAFDNGMRLPKDWLKAAAIIGPVGDWRVADVSAFVKEFVGHPEDLRQRLIGEPFKTYLARRDVAFEFSDAIPYMDQRTGQYIDPLAPDDLDLDEEISDEELAKVLPDQALDEIMGAFSPSVAKLANRTEAWLRASGQSPSSELRDIWGALLFAGAMAMAMGPVEGRAERDAEDRAREALEVLKARPAFTRSDAYRLAVEQCEAHLEAEPGAFTRTLREAVIPPGNGPAAQ